MNAAEGGADLSKLLTIYENDIRHEKSFRMLKCPKCFKWNKASYKQVFDKIFVMTCEKCSTKYRPG